MRHPRRTPDPLGWLLAGLATLAALSAWAPGCGGKRGTGPYVLSPADAAPVPQAPVDSSCCTAPPAPTWSDEPARVEGRWATSPRGVRVWAPLWLSGALLDAALREVDSTVSDPDPRASLTGVPLGLEVVIQDPGAFSTSASPTGLARGMTDMRTRIWCAWRMNPYETTPLLPALRHELRHAATGDAAAGH